MNLNAEEDLTNALENYVREIVEQAVDDKLDTELMADNVKGLNECIEEQISNYLENNQPDIDADNVLGLEETIEKEVKSQLENLKIDACDVDGLDTVISDVLDDWDFTSDTKLMDAVESKTDDYLGDHIEDAVSQALTVVPITVSVGDIPDLEAYTNTLIKQAIKDCQQQFLQRLSPIYWFRRLGSYLKNLFITIIK